MKTAILTLVVAFIAGVLVLTFSAKSPGSPASAPTPQAARAPEAAGLPSPSAVVSQDAERVQSRPQDHRAAEKREQINALYETARKIASVVERDQEYATLVAYATRERDFELAIDIASGMFSVVKRDNNYAKIVYQAILARDFPAADQAAGKMSTVVLRNEQLKKITEACPANAMTQ